MHASRAYMVIPCNATIILTADGGVGATYQWYDSGITIISTDSFITVGPGQYWVAATSVGCAVYSDTLTVFSLGFAPHCLQAVRGSRSPGSRWTCWLILPQSFSFGILFPHPRVLIFVHFPFPQLLGSFY